MGKNLESHTSRHLHSSHHIMEKGSPALSPCHRCIKKSLSCVAISDNRCAACVGLGIEMRCNALTNGVGSRFRDKHRELREVLSEFSLLSSKLSSLIEEFLKECDDMVPESGPSGRSVSSVGVGTDPLSNEAWFSLPIAESEDFAGETS